MIWIKKVATTPLNTSAKVVDSIAQQVNERTNAPSIHAVREAIQNVTIEAYPIGSIYMSVNEVDPTDLFGGIWEKIENKFLLGSSDSFPNGSTGGKRVTTLTISNLPNHKHQYDKAVSVAGHALTTNELPAHSHQITGVKGSTKGTVSGTQTDDILVGTETQGTSQVGGGAEHTHDLNTSTPYTGAAGSGQSFTNMPPYLAVNVWYRVA